MTFVIRRRRNGFAALWRALFTRGGPGLGKRLGALPRMVRDRFRGQYTLLSWKRLVWMAIVTAYIVSPIDFVPEEFLSFIGLADDSVVLLWLVGAVLDETERYLSWEFVGRPALSTLPRVPAAVEGVQQSTVE